jgi:hypothetical protein
MSFKCDYCEKAQDTFVKPNRVVVDTRPKTYTHKNREPTYGREIVHEANLCNTCNARFESV